MSTAVEKVVSSSVKQAVEKTVKEIFETPQAHEFGTELGKALFQSILKKLGRG